MITRRHRALPGAVLAALFALAVPAAASASGVYVSNSAPVGADTSCASPGFNTIQSALDAASGEANIHVCGGVYTEQIEITKPAKLAVATGTGTAKLQMPSSPADSLTECDTAPGLEPGQKDEVSICTAGKVSISGLTIEALAPIETCASGLYGINVGGGAELKATNDTIIGAGTTLPAFKGCQHGVAVEVGSHHAAVVGHAILKGDAISGYEKNGPTVAGAGSTMKVLDSTITRRRRRAPTPPRTASRSPSAHRARSRARVSAATSANSPASAARPTSKTRPTACSSTRQPPAPGCRDRRSRTTTWASTTPRAAPRCPPRRT